MIWKFHVGNQFLIREFSTSYVKYMFCLKRSHVWNFEPRNILCELCIWYVKMVQFRMFFNCEIGMSLVKLCFCYYKRFESGKSSHHNPLAKISHVISHVKFWTTNMVHELSISYGKTFRFRMWNRSFLGGNVSFSMFFTCEMTCEIVARIKF